MFINIFCKIYLQIFSFINDNNLQIFSFTNPLVRYILSLPLFILPMVHESVFFLMPGCCNKIGFMLIEWGRWGLVLSHMEVHEESSSGC